jgi:Taurine catabolism dioxygenase TauD, TfdA family
VGLSQVPAVCDYSEVHTHVLATIAGHLPGVGIAVVGAPHDVALAIAVNVADFIDVPRVRDDPEIDAHVLVAVAGHLPEIGITVVIAPQNVALVVAIEVATKINELSAKESSAVLRFLFDHIVQPEWTFRFRWRAHSIAFWDNRCTQHYAIPDYWPNIRSGFRIQIEGSAAPASWLLRLMIRSASSMTCSDNRSSAAIREVTISLSGFDQLRASVIRKIAGREEFAFRCSLPVSSRELRGGYLCHRKSN